MKKIDSNKVAYFALIAVMLLAQGSAFAGAGAGGGGGGGGGGGAAATALDSGHIKSIVDQIDKLLSAISVIVVMIAFIFSGYQIAFGGKHFRDIAPVVIGAIIVGAAMQLATLIATRA